MFINPVVASPSMFKLSPAAQTVLDAYYCEKPLVGSKRVAAALRAAAEQVLPEEPLYGGDQRWMFERDARQVCRKKLLAIATELEAQ